MSHLIVPAGVTLGGGSIQLALKERWAFETGAAAVFTGIEGLSPEIFARAGITPLLHDGRKADGRGWTTQVVALAGYWYLKRMDAPDGHHGTETTHAVRANAGFDFTGHASPVDFSVRLLSGIAVPFWQTRTGDWEKHLYIDTDSDLHWALDVGVDLGIGF